jgi:hypothetical protein
MPRRLPDDVKKQRGTFRPSRSAAAYDGDVFEPAANVPEPATKVPEPPDDLGGAGRDKWDELWTQYSRALPATILAAAREADRVAAIWDKFENASDERTSTRLAGVHQRASHVLVTREKLVARSHRERLAAEVKQPDPNSRLERIRRDREHWHALTPEERHERILAMLRETPK